MTGTATQEMPWLADYPVYSTYLACSRFKESVDGRNASNHGCKKKEEMCLPASHFLNP